MDTGQSDGAASPTPRSSDARWKVMRFTCPYTGCYHGVEIADHARRDPSTVDAGACPKHAPDLYEFYSERPLYEEGAR